MIKQTDREIQKEPCILMSIHPEYVKLIFNGTKKWEFRKSLPKMNRIMVYSTAPIKKIIGIFFIGNSIIGPPEFVWNHTQKDAGVSKVEFMTYYKNSKTAFALRVLKPTRFMTPLDPYELIPNFHPPQSYKSFDAFTLWGKLT